MIKTLFLGGDFFEITIDKKKSQGKTLADLCQEIEIRQIEAGVK